MNKKLVLPVILLTLMLSLVGLTVGRLALSYGSASQWSETVLIEGQVSVQELATCVQPVEYWRAHSACSTNPGRSAAWDAIGEDTPFYNTGMTWCEVLWADATDPVNDAEQQYIAARLNEAAGVPAPIDVRNAVASIHGWLDFAGEQPYEVIAAHVAVLRDYHNGALFPYLCEPTDNSGTYLEPNTAPVGVDDSYPVEAGAQLVVQASGVLANDSDADGDPLSAAVVAQPQFGSLEFQENGSFTYLPIDGYEGPDLFSYNVSDGTDTVGPVNVTLDVLPAADQKPTPTPTPLSERIEAAPEDQGAQVEDAAAQTPTNTPDVPTSTPTPSADGGEEPSVDPTPTETPVDESQQGSSPGADGSSVDPTPSPTPTPTGEQAEVSEPGEVEEPSQEPEATPTP